MMLLLLLVEEIMLLLRLLGMRMLQGLYLLDVVPSELLEFIQIGLVHFQLEFRFRDILVGD